MHYILCTFNRFIHPTLMALLMVLSVYSSEVFANKPIINLMPKATIENFGKGISRLNNIRNLSELRDAERDMLQAHKLVEESGCFNDDDPGCETIVSGFRSKYIQHNELLLSELEGALINIKDAVRSQEPELKKLGHYSMRQINEMLDKNRIKQHRNNTAYSTKTNKVLLKWLERLNHSGAEDSLVRGATFYSELKETAHLLENIVDTLKHNSATVRTGATVSVLFSSALNANVDEIMTKVLGPQIPEGALLEPYVPVIPGTQQDSCDPLFKE